jgi:hypothetical protein
VKTWSADLDPIFTPDRQCCVSKSRGDQLTMRTAKLIGAAGLLVAASIVGGTLIGGVLAAPTGGTSADGARDPVGGLLLGGERGEYCDVYLDTFASELGVDRDELLPARKAAAIAAIDAAVAGGDLDADRAVQIKERIDAMDDAGCGFVGGLGRAFGHGFAHGFVSADVLNAAALALGIDSDDLVRQVADGGSLEEIAADQDVAYDTVKSAAIAALKAGLDAAVANGLDQERADAVLQRVQAWLDQGGEAGFGRLGEPFGGRFEGGEGPFGNR